MLQMMCEHPDWESADLSSLRYVIYGGSPITEKVAQAWLTGAWSSSRATA